MSVGDTIYALATPPGRGAIAVVRVTGPQAFAAAEALTGRASWPARRAQHVNLYDPVSRETIDNALLLPFHGPNSFTGEDVVEYHLHGGRAVVDAVLDVLGRQDGYRWGEPGEFTRRAFENGKLDLTEAEAVADLVNAETALQRSQALDQLGGKLSAIYSGWAESLKHNLAWLEAHLDFPDEDLPDSLLGQVTPELERLQCEITEHLADNRRGERLREGVQVAIIGAPNAGKSALINALARRDVAIVTEHAGTTRDVLEVHLDIAGYPVTVADTAGLRPDQLEGDSQAMIEAEGIRRAWERARQADLKLLVFDGTELPEIDRHTFDLIDNQSLLIINKQDLINAPVPDELLRYSPWIVAATSGVGLGELVDAMGARIADFIGMRDTPSLTRARHREALQDALGAIKQAQARGELELVAEDLRIAQRDLGRITGKVDVEDMLDVIFRDFCIGK
jgi:tRNA modification GTPase